MPWNRLAIFSEISSVWVSELFVAAGAAAFLGIGLFGMGFFVGLLHGVLA